MEMADSEGSDDASRKSSKQSTDNTRSIKEKVEGITAENGNWKT